MKISKWIKIDNNNKIKKIRKKREKQNNKKISGKCEREAEIEKIKIIKWK